VMRTMTPRIITGAPSRVVSRRPGRRQADGTGTQPGGPHCPRRCLRDQVRLLARGRRFPERPGIVAAAAAAAGPGMSRPARRSRSAGTGRDQIAAARAGKTWPRPVRARTRGTGPAAACVPVPPLRGNRATAGPPGQWQAAVRGPRPLRTQPRRQPCQAPRTERPQRDRHLRGYSDPGRTLGTAFILQQQGGVLTQRQIHRMSLERYPGHPPLSRPGGPRRRVGRPASRRPAGSGGTCLSRAEAGRPDRGRPAPAYARDPRVLSGARPGHGSCFPPQG
jgi:hypothetical protein